MKEKLIYLFVAFCIVVNTILFGTMINEKVEAETVEEIKSYQIGERMVSDIGDTILEVNSCEFFSYKQNIYMKMNVSLFNIGQKKIEVSYFKDFKIECLGREAFPIDYDLTMGLGKYLNMGDIKKFDLFFQLQNDLNTSENKNISLRYSTFKESEVDVFSDKYTGQAKASQFNSGIISITYQNVEIDNTPSIYIGEKNNDYKDEEKTAYVRNPDKIIYASKIYEKNDFKEYYKNDGYIVTEKNYPLNKKYKDIDLELTLLDYSLVNVANDYGEETQENILHGLSSYYFTIDFELENLSGKEYTGCFYDFGLRFTGGYDGQYAYGRNEMGFTANTIYKDYILSATYFNNEYVSGEDYIIGVGETLKGQLIYDLGYGNFDGCGFDLIRLYTEKKITGKMKLVRGVIEIAKRSDKITKDYKPAEAKKEEVILNKEPEHIIEDKYYEIGDTIKSDTASFKIIDIKELEDEEDNKYMVINVQYTNRSEESKTINFENFRLQKKDGAYNSNITYYDKLGIEGLSGEVGIGETITGNIIYDVTSFAIGWGDLSNKGKYKFSYDALINHIVTF
jgi:hypothetical protein